jgi:hypothetical protein
VIPIAVIVIGLTAWFERPLILFVITAVALVVINIACCNWLQRHWEAWIAGNGKRIEQKLDMMRRSRLMKHPVVWIARGSDWWFALATAIVNPIIVVAGARLVAVSGSASAESSSSSASVSASPARARWRLSAPNSPTLPPVASPSNCRLSRAYPSRTASSTQGSSSPRRARQRLRLRGADPGAGRRGGADRRAQGQRLAAHLNHLEMAVLA